MRSTPSRPPLLACAGVLAAFALLSACGGGDDAPAASAAPTGAPSSAPTSAPTSAAAPPTSAAPSSAAPTSTRTATASASASAAPTAAGPAACPSSRLAVTVRPDVGGGAAGSQYETIVFVNQGSTTCTLNGHPGVSYVVGSAGTQVGAPAGRDGVPALVTLAPGGSAHASLRVVDYQTIDRETCQSSPVAGLRIYPPDQTASQFVAAPGSTCADPSVVLLTVGPVAAGVG